jgi:Fe-S cluster assembly protein SufB
MFVSSDQDHLKETDTEARFEFKKEEASTTTPSR